MTNPDPKEILLRHLGEALKLPVVSKRPDSDVPDEFVVITVLGGPGRSQKVLTTASLTVDSYALSTGQAAALAAKVDDLVHALPASPELIAHVVGSTPGELPDPDRTDRPRYTATYQITTKMKRKGP
ncbi:hypothetical protein I6B53_03265 [Schaalia sp. 19OD2882]|uniref:hypothetical protein n=1 Tax=Schaalia sp. 19OD2882 TaxID=2794089 RepID=UPI001C1E9C43|nr:hypothetical protein [Schaalia sp. 19OD2882]QWW20130.1 hypothetical protein I6B53_03265 [Schaalia sp. 19OD2882]